MGEPVFPDYLFADNYETNKATLLKRLNEEDAFDVPMTFKPKDQFEIVISNQSQPIRYSFSYSKGRWIEAEYDTFALMSDYDELMFGKFKHVKS